LILLLILDGLIAGLTVAGLLVLTITAAIGFFYWHRKKGKAKQSYLKTVRYVFVSSTAIYHRVV